MHFPWICLDYAWENLSSAFNWACEADCKGTAGKHAYRACHGCLRIVDNPQNLCIIVECEASVECITHFYDISLAVRQYSSLYTYRVGNRKNA